MALEDLNYDLCGTCYQSISDEEKLLYSDNTVDALTLYAKVYHCIYSWLNYICIQLTLLEYSNKTSTNIHTLQ